MLRNSKGGHAITGLNRFKSRYTQGVAQKARTPGSSSTIIISSAIAPLFHEWAILPIKVTKNGGVSQKKHIHLLHHLPMKPRLLTALALGLAILLATPSTSFADATSTPKPKPKPTPTSKPTPTPTPDFESAVDQYKIAIDEFRAEMKAREQSLNKIRQKFIADVNEAKRIANCKEKC